MKDYRVGPLDRSRREKIQGVNIDTGCRTGSESIEEEILMMEWMFGEKGSREEKKSKLIARFLVW